MIWFFSHFGLVMLILLIDFSVVLGSTYISTDKWDDTEAYMIGCIINAFALAVALSVLILGE